MSTKTSPDPARRDCFAYVGYNDCAALKKLACTGCAFYAHRDDAAAARRASFRRRIAIGAQTTPAEEVAYGVSRQA